MYRIGELARIANVSKRTIDYYTSIGLLEADRSKGNYRIYTEESLKDLDFIETCKRMHYPLDEIKRKLEIRKTKKLRDSEVEKQITAVTQQMKQLQDELIVLLPLFEKMNDDQKQIFSKNLNLEGSALMKSLLNLTS